MLKELNNYRDKNGYININNFFETKLTNNVLTRHYIEIYVMKFFWSKLVPISYRTQLKKNLGIDRNHRIITINNIDYFCKVPSKLIAYSPIMEVIASEIGNYLTNNYVDYDIVEKDNKPFASLSKSFIDNRKKFISFECGGKINEFRKLTLDKALIVLNRLNLNYKDKLIILKQILEIIIVDSFCNQFDRHILNCGIFEIDKADKKEYQTAAVFDSELWFPDGITTEEIKKYSKDKETELMLKYINFCKKIKGYSSDKVIGDYNIYNLINAIEFNNINYLNKIPNIIKDVLQNFNKNLLNKIYCFNFQNIIDKMPYDEIKNNEIYSVLIEKNRNNFIDNIEKNFIKH